MVQLLKFVLFQNVHHNIWNNIYASYTVKILFSKCEFYGNIYTDSPLPPSQYCHNCHRCSSLIYWLLMLLALMNHFLQTGDQLKDTFLWKQNVMKCTVTVYHCGEKKPKNKGKAQEIRTSNKTTYQRRPIAVVIVEWLLRK